MIMRDISLGHADDIWLRKGKMMGRHTFRGVRALGSTDGRFVLQVTETLYSGLTKTSSVQRTGLHSESEALFTF